MRQQNSYSIISDFNKAIRELSSEIADLKAGLQINANTADHLLEKLSNLEEKVNELQKKPPSFGPGNIFALLTLLLVIVGILFGAYEWRIDARLAAHSQKIHEMIDKKIVTIKEGEQK